LRLPGQREERVVRQPVHSVYIPADRFGPGTVRDWGNGALGMLRDHGPLRDYPESTVDMVRTKLAAEPIEDLRVDFEDGYGRRPDAEEDAHAHAAGLALRSMPGRPPFFGLRCKSLEPATVLRAARTVDIFLTALGPPPPGFVITVPKA